MARRASCKKCADGCNGNCCCNDVGFEVCVFVSACHVPGMTTEEPLGGNCCKTVGWYDFEQDAPGGQPRGISFSWNEPPVCITRHVQDVLVYEITHSTENCTEDQLAGVSVVTYIDPPAVTCESTANGGVGWMPGTVCENHTGGGTTTCVGRTPDEFTLSIYDGEDEETRILLYRCFICDATLTDERCSSCSSGSSSSASSESSASYSSESSGSDSSSSSASSQSSSSSESSASSTSGDGSDSSSSSSSISSASSLSSESSASSLSSESSESSASGESSGSGESSA